jgi:succinate dehydrogenase/fumarate reductase flavoprotein subunit
MQQVMMDYCGNVRSEILLKSGLDLIRRLKNKARSMLKASSPHELMNCVQVLNQLEIGELVLISASDRRESRSLHHRSEYTYMDPLLNDKLHIIKQVNGEPITEWIEMKK